MKNAIENKSHLKDFNTQNDVNEEEENAIMSIM